MSTFSLGQRVFWVEVEASPKECTVRVRCKGFLTAKHNGDAVAVVGDDGRTEILSGRQPLFADGSDANAYALGLAVRRLANFGYAAVKIIDHSGTDFTLSPGNSPQLLKVLGQI